MAALDFPSSPVEKQVFDRWYWDGTKWMLSTTDPPESVVGDWITPTLGTNWSNFGGSWQEIQYRKVGDEVSIRGAAAATASTPTEAVLFTLPEGFRPPGQVGFTTRAASVTTGYADVTIAGDVRWRGGAATFFGVLATFSLTA